MTTKIALTILGLATLVATPALAAKAEKPANHAGAYASAAQHAAVVTNGYAVGTDPDANVRFELNRDAPTYSTGN